MNIPSKLPSHAAFNLPSDVLSNSDDSILNEKLPDSFPISVLMESRLAKSQWIDKTWDAVGLLSLSPTDKTLKTEAKEEGNDVKVIQQGEVEQLLYSGLTIRLFLDECESYYHNLMSPEPGCFIVARTDEEAQGSQADVPIPFLVTLSFDEAHAYLEGDDTVYSVSIPAELYRWAEAYILENYSAEKRKKRKRKDWRKGE